MSLGLIEAMRFILETLKAKGQLYLLVGCTEQFGL